MDITMILQSLFALLGVILTSFVVPWLKRMMSAQDRREMLDWVQVAVSAAQQLYPGEEEGDLRKNCALGILETQGFHGDSTEIDSAVEAFVHNLHSGQKDGAAAPSGFGGRRI